MTVKKGQIDDSTKDDQSFLSDIVVAW
jgi:hypothetical protein